MIKILLGDDHAVVRRGIRQILSDAYPQAYFAEAGDTHNLHELISMESWDIVILDLALPDGNGL